MTFNFVLIILVQIIIIVIFILVSVAYLTLLERKILAIIQRRKGPNVVGVFGLFQPLADGFKLLLKEVIIPSNASKFIFLLAPVLSFALSLMSWGVIPFSEKGILSDISTGLIFNLTISSLGVYGIILGGWASNSKYSFLGGLRSTAQMISYEVSMGFCICTVCICNGTFNLNEITFSQQFVWFSFFQSIPFALFFISSLAETNRHPFDLPEAEAELVAGYNTEYSGFSFALFSLAEYSNILLMCTLNSILFLGGWNSIIPFIFSTGPIWLSIKILFFAILFILIRGYLPRFRYDQLMNFGWVICLPISLLFFIFQMSILFTFGIFTK